MRTLLKGGDLARLIEDSLVLRFRVSRSDSDSDTLFRKGHIIRIMLYFVAPFCPDEVS